jgi:hypothetical protein
LGLDHGCFREGKALKIHLISPNLKSEGSVEFLIIIVSPAFTQLQVIFLRK